MKKIRLGDGYIEITAGGDRPSTFSSTKTSLCSVPVYSNGIEDEGLYGFTDKAEISKPAVTISARGSVGEAFLRELPFTPIIRLLSLVPNPKKLNCRYLYYALRNNFLCNSGSVQPQITVPQISDVEIFITEDINKQKEIANTLYLLDKKIKNNASIINEIQKIGRLIYNYWFLQFDFPDKNGKPYKSSGGKMIYSNILKKEIPYGWEVKKLETIIKNVDRSTFDRSIEMPVIDSSVMISKKLNIFKFNSTKNFNTNLFNMNKGDILFGSIRPYLKKACIAPCDGAVAGTVFSFRPIELSDYNFSLFTLCADFFFDYASQSCKGTKMPVIGSDEIFDYPVAYNKDVCALFNKINFNDAISKLIIQNNELSNLRDFLMPILLTEQAKIKN